jgi:hypothetical protein
MTLVASRHLQRKKNVGFDQAMIGHLYWRMVGPQFAELHIESDGFGALRRKLLDQPAINLARPF